MFFLCCLKLHGGICRHGPVGVGLNAAGVQKAGYLKYLLKASMVRVAAVSESGSGSASAEA